MIFFQMISGELVNATWTDRFVFVTEAEVYSLERNLAA